MSISRVLCLVSLITATTGAFIMHQPALAEEAKADTAAPSASPTADASPAASTAADSQPKSNESADADTAAKPQGRVLQGGVKGTAVPLEEGLARIAAANAQIQDTCMQIMKEATRKDTVVMRGPNVLPGGIVIPALGGTGGVMQFGEMPIRRKRLEQWMDNSAQSIAALQSYVDALMVPADNSQAQLAYSDLRSQMASAQQHLAKLQELAAAKRLNNGPIGREALAINDAIAAMEKDRLQLSQVVSSVNITEPAGQ